MYAGGRRRSLTCLTSYYGKMLFVVGCDAARCGLRDCKLYAYTSTRSRCGTFRTWYLRLDLSRADHSAAQHCANEN